MFFHESIRQLNRQKAKVIAPEIPAWKMYQACYVTAEQI